MSGLLSFVRESGSRMSRRKFGRILGLVGCVGLLLGPVALAGGGKTIGKNPGKIKGRWLEIKDSDALGGAREVYIGEVKVDIQWKKERNEAPIDEDLLEEYLVGQLTSNLKESKALGNFLDETPKAKSKGRLRIDVDLVVEPGSRLMRYAVGFGAGKSRSILELHIVDEGTGEEVAMYHGYGVGSGMGFKLAGGTARKMTQDDVQENAKQFVELLAEAK